MTAYDGGPCENWDPIWQCDLTAVSPSVTGNAVSIATEILWALSGRQFGTCRLTIRPCLERCSESYWPGLASWYRWDGGYVWPRFCQGVWTNVLCGDCYEDCSCTSVSSVNLPSPVVQINAVKVDGVTLAPNLYRVDNWRKLVRLGGACWPECNDLSKADTEVGTWSIDLTLGKVVPDSGRAAVGEFACELIKLFTGSACALPKPVQQLVRQGVTMTFLDPNELFGDGRIGLYLSDMFIATWNPNKLTNRSRAYDIDAPGYRIAGT